MVQKRAQNGKMRLVSHMPFAVSTKMCANASIFFFTVAAVKVEKLNFSLIFFLAKIKSFVFQDCEEKFDKVY